MRAWVELVFIAVGYFMVFVLLIPFAYAILTLRAFDSAFEIHMLPVLIPFNILGFLLVSALKVREIRPIQTVFNYIIFVSAVCFYLSLLYLGWHMISNEFLRSLSLKEIALGAIKAILGPSVIYFLAKLLKLLKYR